MKLQFWEMSIKLRIGFKSSFLQHLNLTMANVIVANVSSDDDLQLSDLSFRKIAAVEGYAIVEHIKSVNPNIEVVTVKNDIEALKLASFNQVDAIVIGIAVASYYIDKPQISNLKWPVMSTMIMCTVLQCIRTT